MPLRNLALFYRFQKCFIEPEIYTLECRKMQLRVFVKTKFSRDACPCTPVAKLRTCGIG